MRAFGHSRRCRFERLEPCQICQFGVGEGRRPQRKKALLKRFGSVRRIREASVEEVAETPGVNRELAERLKSVLAREGMLA